jgi:eukaryotic-like serine/threonine-protein kinase
MSESWDGRERLVAGRFLLLRELGRGGMGTVWLAADETLGRQVAIKELRPRQGLPGADLAAQRQRALREARSAARIQHANAVTLYEVIPAGAGDEAVYLIMEFVEGPTLGELIVGEGPLPASRVAHYGLQLLDVLEAAHALGIVHRDVKPGNILIATGDQVKLADFGIAHIAGAARLTRGGVMGTYAYMAPELFDSAPITPSADLWSLGATLYDAAEGRGPFDRDSTAEILRAILVADLPVPHCEPHLAAAIEGLLRRDPRERATPGETRAHLRQVPGIPPANGPNSVPRRGWDPNRPTGQQTGGWPTDPPVPPPPPPTDTHPRRRGRVRLAAAGVALLAVAGVAAAILATRPSAHSEAIDSQGNTTIADSPTASPRPAGKASAASPGPTRAVSSATTRPPSAPPPATVAQTTAPAVVPTVARASVGSATTSPCATHDLTATLGPYHPNAGNIDQIIDFTNVSGATCTLYGYPGVALTTGTTPAAQVGAAANRTSSAPSLVTLAPGKTANAQLEIVDAENYPSCSPIATSYLQIYLPEQTAATYLPFTSTGCRSAAVQLLFIDVVRQGEGT